MDRLLALLKQCVIKPFGRICDIGAIVVPLVPTQTEDADDLPANPGHPACAKYVGSDYCRESWQLHLAELNQRPEAHWHKCDFGMFCALIPVAHEGQCLAAVRLACPATMPEEAFDRHVELLDILVENFVTAQADLLGRTLRAAQATKQCTVPASSVMKTAADQTPNHPLILQSIQIIEEHLSEPSLSVGHVARQVGTSPNHLSSLFVEQVGQRMSRFIIVRRIEHAKMLLATTNGQIKGIASAAGFAHPSWFCRMFIEHTGLSPMAYRKKARAGKADK